MSHFYSLSYWFTSNPEPLSSLAWKILIALMAILIIMIIASAFLKMRPGVYRGFLKRWHTFSLANFLLGLLFLFFNYETIPFFSARFWLGAWFIFMIIWKLFIMRSLKKIPAIVKEKNEKAERDKYLP